MSAIRIVFHVVIGINKRSVDADLMNSVCMDLDERLTRLTGGVTRFIGSGTWTPESQQDRFDGQIESDISVNYLIAVPAIHEEATLNGLRSSVTAVVKRYRLPVRYVHVSRTIAEERIFCIEQEGCLSATA